MRRNIETIIPSPFVRFALMGGIAAAANIVSRILLSQILRYEYAIVISYLIGMTVAYVLMKLFVFEQSQRSNASEYVRFGAVNLIALAQVWFVSLFLARWALPAVGFHEHIETLAHMAGVLSPIGTSYVAHRYFTFA